MSNYDYALKIIALQIRRLLGSPRSRDIDHEIYRAEMTRVMLAYPTHRLERITDRVIDSCDWMPTAADWKRAAEIECQDLIRQEAREARAMLPAPPPPEKKPLDWTGLLKRLRGNEKTEPHWTDVSAAQLRAMPGFAETRDAPLRSWGKMK